MSSKASPAVRIIGLSKEYRLAASSATSLTEVVASAVRGKSRVNEKLHALRDITLDIDTGDVLGIIGHNGAGKSTLLKILSRVTEPSAGRVEIRGRVGALLEVGTGFHPELTGRENIYLNGSILGMRRSEVKARFDDIVEFSGVEKFLDLPVKRYSSGMSVRLAFSVASSLSSDVLIVDEVLAVGDVEFQKKCLGRMAEVSKEGRTVLFVSHNLAAVQALCSRAVLLKSGVVDAQGTPDEMVHEYLSGLGTSGTGTAPGVTDVSVDDKGATRPHLRTISVRSARGRETTETLTTGGPAEFTIELEGLDELTLPHVGLSFWTETETLVATATTQMRPPVVDDPTATQKRLVLTIDKLPLIPGSYWVDVGVRAAGAQEYLDLAVRAFSITVVGMDVYGSGVLPISGEGVIYLEHSWRAET